MVGKLVVGSHLATKGWSSATLKMASCLGQLPPRASEEWPGIATAGLRGEAGSKHLHQASEKWAFGVRSGRTVRDGRREGREFKMGQSPRPDFTDTSFSLKLSMS